MTYGWAAVAAALLIGTSAQAQSQESLPIAVGETLNGELRTGDRKAEDNSLYDIFLFRGQAGQRVAITLQAANFDAYLQLYSGDRQLKADDDGGGGTNARINFTLPSTGEYVIWANGVSASDGGAYSLTLVQTAQAAAVAVVNPIRVGQTVNGRLEAGDALADDDSLYDLYRFRGAAGDRMTVRLKSEDFDTYVGLHAAGKAEELATNDDRGEDDTNSEVTFTLPAAGEYDIWANSLARDKAGAYQLSLARAPSTAAGKAQTLRFDRAVKGRLAQGDPKAGDDSYYDRYRFRGRAGEQVTVTMSSQDFDSYLSVHRMGEVRELATNDDGPRGPDSVLVFTVPAAGDYDIWANTLGDGETGDYILLLTRGAPRAPAARPRSPPPAAQPIALGQTLRGELTANDATLSDDSRYDLYRFDGVSGQRVIITMTSTEFDAYVGLLEGSDPEEAVKTDDDGGDGSNARLSFVLRRNGPHMIRANSLTSGETGAYAVRLELGEPVPAVAAQEIALGRAVGGRLAAGDAEAEDGSYFDAYRFRAEAGRAYEISLKSGAFDTWLVLYADAETELDSDDDSGGGTDSQLSFTASRAGEFIIRANSVVSGATGDYVLEVRAK